VIFLKQSKNQIFLSTLHTGDVAVLTI